MDAFVADYLKNNPGEDRNTITAGLKDAFNAYNCRVLHIRRAGADGTRSVPATFFRHLLMRRS